MLTALLLFALQDPAPEAGVRLAAPATVTLERAERTVGEILKAVRSQTGLKVEASQLDESKKVTIGWKGSPVLQSLDELCRALGAGQVRSSKDEISLDGSAALPRAVGHGERFRFEVENVQVTTTRRLSGTTRTVNVTLRYDAQPGTDLAQATPGVRLEEALDDRGWSLLGVEMHQHGMGEVPLEDQEDPDVVEFERRHGGAGLGLARMTVAVQAPARDAKAIEYIRCRAALTFPMRNVDGEVPVAELVDGKEFQIGSMTVRVKKFEQKGAEATLEFTYRGGGRSEYGGSMPWLNLVDAEGKTVSQGMSGGGGGDGYKWQYRLKSDAPVAAIQYKATAGRITKVVRFEIRNIPLPGKE
ncbi:MAG TPA: hypothetical protein VFC90_09065 [Planctomycetota bacterium]|nr:hypothetical protein [Planctomycetota bacterium]